MNLVEPLGHKPTARRTTDTTAPSATRSGAVTPLIGATLRLRQGDYSRNNAWIQDFEYGNSNNDDKDNEHRMAPYISSHHPHSFDRLTQPLLRHPQCSRPVRKFIGLIDIDTAAVRRSTQVQAYIDCRRSKRNSASALAFEQHMERNLCHLYDELTRGAYRPGRSICFVVTRPKPREVWAADFRDRIVHHLLYNHIAPRFHAGFVAGSSACISRPGMRPKNTSGRSISTS
eukprot:gene62-82_t